MSTNDQAAGDNTTGCCCETHWYGRRPEKAKPLTDEFIRAVAAQGGIVPPRDGFDSPWTRVLGTVAIVGLACVCAWLLVVYGTRA